MVELANAIASAGGGGVVLTYNKANGTWNGPAPIPGRPLILISDWYTESDISDSGFFRSGRRFNFCCPGAFKSEQQNKIFTSPLHFIGHSRGTVVNSEIIQRFGTYFPNVNDIQMTTLDPHDRKQDSLNIDVKKILETTRELATIVKNVTAVGKVVGKVAIHPGLKVIGVISTILNPIASSLEAMTKAALRGVGPAGNLGIALEPIPYGDFQDPDVKVWENVAYADSYYQTNGGTKMTATPNGFPVEGADLEIELNGLVGFTQDDLEILGASIGWGGPHSRVWQWYAGTVDLG